MESKKTIKRFLALINEGWKPAGLGQIVNDKHGMANLTIEEYRIFYSLYFPD